MGAAASAQGLSSDTAKALEGLPEAAQKELLAMSQLGSSAAASPAPAAKAEAPGAAAAAAPEAAAAVTSDQPAPAKDSLEAAMQEAAAASPPPKKNGGGDLLGVMLPSDPSKLTHSVTHTHLLPRLQNKWKQSLERRTV